MTIASARHEANERARGAGATARFYRPTIVLARYHAAAILRRIAVSYACFLMLALGVEYTWSWEALAGMAHGLAPVEALRLYLWFTLLAAAYVTANILGIAVFFGMLWWEVQQSRMGERVVIWGCGQSPARSLATALLIGLLFAPVQILFDTWLRPEAVRSQVDNGLGSIGSWLDRRLTGRFTWASAGNDIVHARIDYAPPGVLHDLTLYRFSPDGRLARIFKAQRATLTQTPGVWRLDSPIQNEIVPGIGRPVRAAPEPESTASVTAAKSDSRLLYIAIDPALLRYRDMPADFISLDALRNLVARGSQRHMIDDYATMIHHYASRAFYPGLMAALAATLAMFAIGRLTPFAIYFAMFAAGYLSHIWMKISVALGMLGFLAPAVSGWLGVSVLAMLIVLMQIRLGWRPVGR